MERAVRPLKAVVFLSAILLGLIFTSPAALAAPFAYISNYGEDTVSVIDTATNTVTSSIEVYFNPSSVAVNRSGNRVYVTGIRSEVWVIDTATNAVIATINDVGNGGQQGGIAVTPDETKIYVARDDNEVAVIDAATNTVTGTIAVGSYVNGISINPSGTRAYVTNHTDNTISVIDTSTDTVVDTVSVDASPRGSVFSPDGMRLYVVCGMDGENSVVAVDTGANEVVPAERVAIGTGGRSWGIAITPDGSTLYITRPYGGDVKVIDVASHTLTATIPLTNSYPVGVAVNPAGTRVYVADDTGGNTVSVIDTSTNAVVATIPVGVRPFASGQFIVPNGGCVPPPSGLLSWWSGDGSPLDVTDANNGTLMGGATYAAGKVGQAFFFDGSEGSFVEIPNSAGLNPSGAFTVGGWFYIDPAAPGNAGEIASLATKTEGSSGNCWAIYFDDRWSTKSLKFVLGGVMEAQNAVPAAGWYHIAGVFDPAAMPRARIYVNGVSAADSGGWGGTTVSANGLSVRIGAMHWTDSYHQGNDRLNGKADEVVFVNQALSAAEIAAIYDAGSAGLCRSCMPAPSGLVSLWKGEDNADDSAGTNDGALTGGATYAPGKVGKAFSFDGVDDFVQVLNPANIPAGNTPRTIAAWVKSAGGTNLYQGIVGYGTPSPAQVLFFEWGGNDVDLNRLYHMNLAWGGRGATLLAYDTWYHAALTHDGISTKLYVNGQLDSSVAMTQDTVMNAAGLMIGKSPDYDGWHKYFKGLIDEVAIFNRELTPSEIAAIYDAGSAGICAQDTAPDAFTFTDATGAEPGSVVESDAVTMADIESPAPVSITGGEYSISTDGGANWGEWTGEDGTVADEDQVKVRQTASPGYEATTDAVLTVGGVSDTFSVTTRAPVLTMAVNTASMGGVSPAAGTHTYPSGTEVEITATPADACHTFTGWSGGAAGTENPTTVTVDADMTVTANFAAIQYTVTTTANPDYCGSVSGSGSYSCGGTAILEATANHGYEFAFWTGDTGTDNPLPTGNPLSFTVDGDKTVNAHFRREGVILTGSQTGASVTFTASVLDSGTPLKGKTVKFYARTATTNWALKASGLTLANGICTKQLTFGTGYWYVKAECQATPSYKMISNEMDFPVGPVLLVFPVTGYVTTDSTPSVGWEPYPGALGYTVQVSSTIYFRPLTTSAASYGPEVTSCGLAGIVGPFPRGVRKYWRVIAVLQTGTSLPSKYRAVTYKEAGQLINLDLQATATSVKPTVRLVDSIGGSIAGKYVYFYYKAESSSSWLSMGSDLTDANGVAVLGTAKKLAAGGYEIKAAFKGTTTYAPCESVEAVQVGVPG